MTTMLLFEQNRTDGQKVDLIYWLIYLTCPLIGGVFAGILWRMHASVLQEQATGFDKRACALDQVRRYGYESIRRYIQRDNYSGLPQGIR